jgi:hypothetical protein
MDALEAFKQFKNESGTYDIDGESLKEILSKFIPTPKEKTKRPPSTYMKWLNDNRQNIKEKFFSDYEAIETWDEDIVKGYYTDKGLGEPKKFKKPNMCILISVKAGQLWKELSDEEKSKYSKPKVEEVKDEEVKGVEVKGAEVNGAEVKGAEVKGVEVKGVEVKGAEVKGVKVKGSKVKGSKVKTVSDKTKASKDKK